MKEQKRSRSRRQQPNGEQQLANVVLKRRSDSDGYPLINDWLEFAILSVAMLGVIGGAIALAHLWQQVQ